MAKSLAELLKSSVSINPTAGFGVSLDLNGNLPEAVRKLLPGYQYDYQEITGNVTVSGSEAAPTDVISSAVLQFDGITPIIIEFGACFIDSAAAAGATTILNLWDGTDLGRLTGSVTPAAAVMVVPVYVQRRMTPSAGTHTFKIRGWQASGNGVVEVGAGGVGTRFPGYLRIVRG